MTRTAVTTPHTASGHISIDIISHLGADLVANPEALPMRVGDGAP
jgi:hypothetical protein